MSQQQDAPPVCAICLENISPTTELARPSVCQHKFCRPCLEHFCRSSPQGQRRCPLDRKSFDRICVPGPAGEMIFDAATLAQLGKIFVSQAVPASLACALLAVLWASPNWMLAAHIVSIGGVYWHTDGVAKWELYTTHCVGLYLCLVPLKFFGFLFTAYALSCGVLVYRMCLQVPDLASRNVTPEKVLLFVTCTLLCLVSPVLTFSLYTLMQACCYVICALLISAMQSSLCEAFGHQYVSFSLLFSNLVMLPFLCLLSDLTLLHLVYYCLLAGYFAFVANSAADASNQPLQHTLHALGVCLSRVACYFAPSVILGFSPWTVLYTVAMLIYLGVLIQFNLVARLSQSVSLLLIVSSVMIGLLLPWQLFGLVSYLGSLVPVGGSCILTELFIKRITSLPAAQPFLLLPLQFATLGVLLPVAIF